MTTTDAEAIARIIEAEIEHDIKGNIAWASGKRAATAILSYLASRREAVANDDIADALEKCDWSGASIGNKAIVASAIERLRENVLFCQDAADNLALIDYIADKIGLPKNEELSRENFATWLAASRREAEPEYIYDDVRFNQGVLHVVDMLARNLGVTDWAVGDGSEDYDDGLWQTVLNILAAKGMYDADSGEFASRREAQEPDWHDDPSADERWQAGCDFVLEQLCGALNVDPKQVRWDAATETLDGDVVAVICDILRQRFGDDFDPFITAPPAPADEVERLRGALKKIKSLLSYANQNIVTPAARQSNINSAWWQADAALNGGRADG